MHPYPDWAAMQAYYGSGVAMPPPYLTAAVASGHAPPYIWGPQPFMPPYGTPFTAIYSHGVYAQPSVPLASQSQGQGIVPSPSTNEAVVMATPLSIEPPPKSSGNRGRGLMKKLKGLDGLPVSNGDCNITNNTSGGAVHGQSQSGESSAEGSSDGSDRSNESGDNKRGSSEDYLNSGKDEKAVRTENAIYAEEANQSPNMPSEVSMASANINGKPKDIPSSSPAPGMESKVSASREVKASTAPVPPANGVPNELWRQDERTLKRERRKQSNRESARRSRLRKQAETEELAMRVDTLGAENMTLRTEIIRLKESSERLRLENTDLMGTLNNSHLSRAEESSSEKVQSQGLPTISTENFLSRLNNSNSFSSGDKPEVDSPENSNGKLHQLLGPNSRTDAVAAG